jgi:thiamine biosynthesis lipoprotein
VLNRRQFLKPAPLPPNDGEYWLHVSRAAMACRFDVTLPLNARAGIRIARSALDQIGLLERQLTVFREDSEVSYINREAARQPVRVEPALFELLMLSQRLHLQTGGAFDITSTPLSRCWGFLRRQGSIPAPAQLEAARAKVGAEKLTLDVQARSVEFASEGVEINLGSIGKGYALDRVASLIGRSVPTALLSAGASSIRAIGNGDPRGNGWIVGLRNPRYKRKRLGVLRVRDCAVSTSGDEEQFFEHEGKRYGHIIDPRNGLPADIVSGVTVVAETAAISDALATAFYVGGPQLAERYCAEHPGTMAVMLERGADHPVVFGQNDRCEVETKHG